MIIREHALERFWLERRLEFLSIVDEYENEAFYNGQSEIHLWDDRFVILKKYYADVIEPYAMS